jgi:hypothetical protein
MKECITHFNACDCREEKFKNLYMATNELLAIIGMEGEIDSRHEKVADAMEALFALDEGVYDVNRFEGRKNCE